MAAPLYCLQRIRFVSFRAVGGTANIVIDVLLAQQKSLVASSVVDHTQNVSAGKHNRGKGNHATIYIIIPKGIEKGPNPKHRGEEQEEDEKMTQMTDRCRRSAVLIIVGRSIADDNNFEILIQHTARLN